MSSKLTAMVKIGVPLKNPLYARHIFSKSENALEKVTLLNDGEQLMSLPVAWQYLKISPVAKNVNSLYQLFLFFCITLSLSCNTFSKALWHS